MIFTAVHLKKSQEKTKTGTQALILPSQGPPKLHRLPPQGPEVVADDERNAAYIVPSVFHPDVTKVVATAVERAARAAGVAQHVHPHHVGGPLHDIAGRA